MNAHTRSPAPLPDAIEAEQALLGACLVNNSAYWSVAGFLNADHFSEPLHRLIYSTAGTMITEGRAVNPVTVKSYLPADQKVGDMTVAQYLAHLSVNAVTIINAYDYGRAIIEAWSRRQLIGVAEDLDDLARNMPVDMGLTRVFDHVEDKLAGLRQASAEPDRGEGTVAGDVDEIMDSFSSSVHAPSIPLPLPQLREILSGDLEAGNLYGMLSGSGEGKTSLVLQMVDHAAKSGHPVIVFSYDQSKKQIIDQIASQRTGIENTRIRNRTLMEREVDRYFVELQNIKSLPLAVIKCNGQFDTAVLVAAKAKRILTSTFRGFDKPALVVVDHTRKVKPRDERAHEGRIAAEINGVFKQTASELGIVWLNLMQRSATGAKRRNPRPIDSDIFGGEMGREDYDAVFYLYRAWKYWQNQIATADDSKDEDRINARFIREKWQEDQAELGALKWRFGDPSKKFRVRFEAEFTRYVSMRDEGDPSFPGMEDF